jgi:hypothetical protein
LEVDVFEVDVFEVNIETLQHRLNGIDQKLPPIACPKKFQLKNFSILIGRFIHATKSVKILKNSP